MAKATEKPKADKEQTAAPADTAGGQVAAAPAEAAAPSGPEAAQAGPDQPIEADTDRPDAADEDQVLDVEGATLVPMSNGDFEMTDEAKALLIDACQLFGIVPTAECRPKELLGWQYYGPDRRNDRPAYVTLVTAGGVKLTHYADPDYPMEPETEATLARLFGAFTKHPETKAVVRTPLPADLALPVQAITGIPPKEQPNVYRRGYLREGGKTEAGKRAKAAKAKKK